MVERTKRASGAVEHPFPSHRPHRCCCLLPSPFPSPAVPDDLPCLVHYADLREFQATGVISRGPDAGRRRGDVAANAGAVLSRVVSQPATATAQGPAAASTARGRAASRSKRGGQSSAVVASSTMATSTAASYSTARGGYGPATGAMMMPSTGYLPFSNAAYRPGVGGVAQPGSPFPPSTR